MDFIKYFQQWFAEHITMFLLFLVPAVVLFWLIDKQIIPILFKSSEKRKKIRHRVFQVKIIFWVVAIGIYLVNQASSDFFATIVPLTIFAVLGYFLLNNFITGIFIRFEGKMKVGQTLLFEGVQGTIVEFLRTKLRIIDNSQNIYDIPYSKFERNTIIQPNDQTFSSLDELILPITKEKYPVAEVEVRKYLEKSPWILQNQGIEVEYADEFMHVHFKLLEKEVKKNIKQDVKNILAKDHSSILS